MTRSQMCVEFGFGRLILAVCFPHCLLLSICLHLTLSEYSSTNQSGWYKQRVCSKTSMGNRPSKNTNFKIIYTQCTVTYFGILHGSDAICAVGYVFFFVVLTFLFFPTATWFWEINKTRTSISSKLLCTYRVCHVRSLPRKKPRAREIRCTLQGCCLRRIRLSMPLPRHAALCSI